MTSARDLPSLVRFSVEAEEAGFDAVMVSEHVVLGPGADADGLPANPRDYALPGNQDPSTPWPSSLLLLAAVAAATSRLRLVAGAIIPPAPTPVAPGEGSRHARPPVRRPVGRPADRELASRRIRRARCAVRVARRTARRAPGGVERAVARLTGLVRGHALPVPRRVPGTQAVPTGRADALVRRQLAARAAPSTHRAVRERLQPLGSCDTRGARPAARRDGRRRAKHGRAGDGRGDTRSVPRPHRASRIWTTPCRRSPGRCRRASRPSASSRHSSSTIPRSSARSAGGSSSGWPRS